MTLEGLIILGAIELGLLLIFSLWYLAHGWWATRILESRQALFGRAAAALSRFVGSARQSLEPEELDLVRTLSRARQLSLFTKIASIVSPSDREALHEVATTLGLIEHARGRTESRVWWKRLEAVRFLAALGSRELSPASFFDDPSVEVRAQAMEWAGDLADPRWVSALIEGFGDPSGLCRHTAQDSLLRIGHPAAGPLAEYLSEPRSAGQTEAALVVARGVADASLLESLLSLAADGRSSVREGVASALGTIGGERARVQLRMLADDVDGGVRATAVESLAATAGPLEASSVASHLTDPEWNVRREAALALRRMGAPGLILLRNAQRSNDRFARDMATLVLELPKERNDR